MSILRTLESLNPEVGTSLERIARSGGGRYTVKRVTSSYWLLEEVDGPYDLYIHRGSDDLPEWLTGTRHPGDNTVHCPSCGHPLVVPHTEGNRGLGAMRKDQQRPLTILWCSNCDMPWYDTGGGALICTSRPAGIAPAR